MTLSKCIAFAACLTWGSLAVAQQRPSDIYGWGKARWGMSVAALKAAYGAPLQETPIDQTSGKDDGVKEFSLPNVKVGEMTLDATFSTYPHSGEIRGVNFSLPEGVEPHGEYHQLLRLLTLKYGKPTREDSPERKDVNSKGAAWLFPSTAIELSLIRVEYIKVEILTLSYWATDKKALGVL